MMLTELAELVADGEIDTVIVAFADMQGRSPASGSRRGCSSKRSPRTAPNAVTICFAVDVDGRTPLTGMRCRAGGPVTATWS